MPKRTYTPEFKQEVLGYAQDHTQSAASKYYTVPMATISGWKEAEDEPHVRIKSSTPVSVIRHGIALLDEGIPMATIGRWLGSSAEDVVRWRDDPTFREATFEYDPAFVYDINDVYDRLTVAHGLIRSEPGMDNAERLEIALAAITIGG